MHYTHKSGSGPERSVSDYTPLTSHPVQDPPHSCTVFRFSRPGFFIVDPDPIPATQGLFIPPKTGKDDGGMAYFESPE